MLNIITVIALLILSITVAMQTLTLHMMQKTHLLLCQRLDLLEERVRDIELNK